MHLSACTEAAGLPGWCKWVTSRAGAVPSIYLTGPLLLTLSTLVFLSKRHWLLILWVLAALWRLAALWQPSCRISQPEFGLCERSYAGSAVMNAFLYTYAIPPLLPKFFLPPACC